MDGPKLAHGLDEKYIEIWPRKQKGRIKRPSYQWQENTKKNTRERGCGVWEVFKYILSGISSFTPTKCPLFIY
jgi:hypothetical protein